LAPDDEGVSGTGTGVGAGTDVAGERAGSDAPEGAGVGLLASGCRGGHAVHLEKAGETTGRVALDRSEAGSCRRGSPAEGPHAAAYRPDRHGSEGEGRGVEEGLSRFAKDNAGGRN
jgi:hypothetical protein